MDTLPYELLVDVFRMMTMADINNCSRLTKMMKDILQLLSRQSVILCDDDGESKYNNPIAVTTQFNVCLPNSLVYLKTSQSKIVSNTLQYLFFSNSDSHYGNDDFIGEWCPKLTHLGGSGIYFNFPSELPKSLVYLRFSGCPSATFNDDITKLTNLKYLKIRFFYVSNGVISFKHSKSLTHLILRDNFTNTIETWPANLTYLKIASNHGLVLPKTLTHLIIKKHEKFVYGFDGSLIKHNEQLDLPRLQYLEIVNTDSNVLHLDVPNLKIRYFKNLTFGDNLESFTITNTLLTCPKFPSSLKKLSVARYSVVLSEPLLNSIANLKLTHLRLFNGEPGHKDLFLNWLNKVELPELIHLSAYSSANDITKLPLNLTHLKLRNKEYGRILCLSKSKITHLHLLYFNHDESFDGGLPETLTHLKVRQIMSQSYILPKNLKTLSIEKYEYCVIPNLPNNLTHLILFCTIDEISADDKIVNKSRLPRSLKYLKTSFNLFSDIPKTIKMVVLVQEKND